MNYKTPRKVSAAECFFYPNKKTTRKNTTVLGYCIHFLIFQRTSQTDALHNVKTSLKPLAPPQRSGESPKQHGEVKSNFSLPQSFGSGLKTHLFFLGLR